MNKTALASLPLALVTLVALGNFATAQDGVMHEHSSVSSSTSEVGVKGYAFKYKERFRNYSEQIDTAVTKGWLTADQATKFRNELADLRKEEAAASKKGYPKEDIDALDKSQTKFNEDLTNAEQTKPDKIKKQAVPSP